MKDGERRRVLPFGWYPSHRSDVEKVIAEWEGTVQDGRDLNGRAAIVPHAGWSFSGRLAFRTLRLLNPECKSVIVIGGHMLAGGGVVAAYEKTVETPLGPMKTDQAFLDLLSEQIGIRYDDRADNTVEVQLPIIKHLFPEASLVWLRVGAGNEAVNLGRCIAGAAKEYAEPVCIVGSTDLTHYGPNYGFVPHGTGRQAREWAQKVNDTGIIRHMLEMNPLKVLEWGNQNQAACSAGAAATAIEYASLCGCEEGVLIGYESSFDLHPDSSFVGYAGIIYSNRDN